MKMAKQILLLPLLTLFLLGPAMDSYPQDSNREDRDKGYFLPPYLVEVERRLADTKPDKALIYFLRYDAFYIAPPVVVGLITTLTFSKRKMWVFADRQLVAIAPSMAPSIFYAYVEPGERLFWVTPKKKRHNVSAIRMNVEAGKTYLLRIGTFSVKGAQIVVEDAHDVKQAIEHFHNYKLLPGKVKKQADKILAREYQHAVSAAKSYPLSIVGSAPFIGSFYRPETYVKKKFLYYIATSDKKYGRPRKDKALIYIMMRDKKDLPISKKIAIWGFADRQLLGVTYCCNKYAYAWVDPGEYLLWSTMYYWPLIGKKPGYLSAIRMRVEANRTYYLEHYIMQGMHVALRLRVVEPEVGEQILQQMEYITTPSKKALKKTAKVLDEFYPWARKVQAAYPETVYGKAYFPPLPKAEKEE